MVDTVAHGRLPSEDGEGGDTIFARDREVELGRSLGVPVQFASAMSGLARCPGVLARGLLHDELRVWSPLVTERERPRASDARDRFEGDSDQSIFTVLGDLGVAHVRLRRQWTPRGRRPHRERSSS